ncbi:MAG: RNA polymerase factor sigma-54 [Microgenomates group bacterium]
MSQRPGIRVTQTQRLALNHSLQASIVLLRADAAGLTRYLEEQATKNPHLRLDPPEPAAAHDWLPRWAGAFGNVSTGHFSSADFASAIDSAAEAAPSLYAHVIAAIGTMTLTARERLVSLAFLDALEPTGWISQPISVIARAAGVAEKEAAGVLAKLQRIDPPGLFARDLAECLTLQLDAEGLADRPMGVLLQHLHLLAAGDFDTLCVLCELPQSEIIRRFGLIRRLNPKPGGDFSPVSAAMIREPDLIARPDQDGTWVLSLNRSLLPSVRVEQSSKGTAQDLAAAKSLVKVVEARNATLLKVATEIALRQKHALGEGTIAIIPMRMSEVAQAVGLHESTVSRVIAGASLDTPRGSIWLRELFSAAVGQENEPNVAGAALRGHLSRLIAAELPEKPLSDQKLAQLIHTMLGVTVARRTIAKYRELQGIQAASLRKRQRPGFRSF